MTRPGIHPSWIVIAAASLWATAAAAHLAQVRQGRALVANQRHYQAQALRLLRKGRLDLPFDQSVLYPSMLAGIYGLTKTEAPLAVRLLQAIMAGLLVFLIGLLGLRTLGPWQGAFAACLAATNSTLAVVTTQIVPTLPALLLLTTAFLFGDLAVTTQSRSRMLGLALAGGLAAGLAAAFQSFVLPAAIIAGLFFMAHRRRRTMSAAYFAGLGLIPALVGTVTMIHTGRPVPLTDNAGLNLYLGWNPSADGTDPFFDPMQIRHRRSLAHGAPAGSHDRAMAKAALDYVTRCPGHSLALAGRKLALFFDHQDLGNNERPGRIAALSSATAHMPGLWLLLALAMAGLVWCFPSPRALPSIGASLIGASLISVLFFTCARFRLLALPGLALAAGSLASTAPHKRWKRATIALAAATATFLVGIAAHQFVEPPTSSGLLVNDAIEALGHNRTSEASALLERAATSRSDDVLARLYLARIAKNQSRICRALFEAGAAVLADPTSSQARRAFQTVARQAGLGRTTISLFGQDTVRSFDRRYAAFLRACRSRAMDLGPARRLENQCRALRADTKANIDTPQ